MRALAVVTALLTGGAPVWPVLAQAPAPAPAAGQAAPPAPQATSAGQAAAPAGQAAQGEQKKLSPDQLDALVAPIALFPDPLLSQSLMASTYPLEIIQAQQFVAKNSKLKADELEKAIKAQDWEPAVQATAMMPDLLKRLAEDITWTTNLGNAFLAQQQEVMDAVQRLRGKAKASGKLESNDKMKVETKVVESQTVVVIEPASPQVVYVPVYSPTVVWGPPVYPYPPVYYPPPPPPGAMLFTFTAGMMVGAAMHGGYCCGCGWGHSNTVVVNHNNTFVSNRNVQNNVRPGGPSSSWQHSPQHRGGAPYGDRTTAAKYGGQGRGGAGPSTMDRGAAGGSGMNRGGAGPSTMDRGAAGGSGMNRGGAGPSTMDRGAAGGSGMNRGGAGPSTMDRGGGGYGGGGGGYGGGGGGYGGGGAQVGNRSVGPPSGGSAFGGSGGGGNRAMASSSRGASSMGGGGRGGGGRGGGGRR